MDIIFKNRVMEYTGGLKFNTNVGKYEVFMREDNEEEWEYVCVVDTEQMISNFKNGVWIEVKE